MRTAAVGLAIVILLGVFGVLFFIRQFRESAVPVSSTAPTASTTLLGSSGTKNNTNSIEITVPLSNALVRSPLAISGNAKGLWYFEGQFPVELIDTKGTVLASGAAHAEGDWMSENFVPFSLTLDFQPPTTTATGLLVFKKDNPSGDPSRDIIFAIPVRFSR